MPLTAEQLIELRKRETPFGNRLADARQLLGMTQVQLATAIGISQSSLSDLERSRYGTTTVETASKFSMFFGCAIEDLFPSREEAGVQS
jgi:transcriptional regulator with XRE-family HTH domain